MYFFIKWNKNKKKWIKNIDMNLSVKSTEGENLHWKSDNIYSTHVHHSFEQISWKAFHFFFPYAIDFSNFPHTQKLIDLCNDKWPDTFIPAVDESLWHTFLSFIMWLNVCGWCTIAQTSLMCHLIWYDDILKRQWSAKNKDKKSKKLESSNISYLGFGVFFISNW